LIRPLFENKLEEEMAGATQNFDAVVIGAGFSGIYMLKSLRDKLGLKVRVYEAGDTVGGTWYWNRYPGARCDSDAYIYCFTFDKQLLQEWEWSERYPEQPEILRYLEHVAKRHDLKRDIQFGTRVTGAEFDEQTNLWTVHNDKGEDVTARFLIAAVGTLSETNMPKFKGLEKFKGKWYHTSKFPHTGVDFTGKRVGVVGTGATAVQAIPEIAQQAKQLVVFQRTANYCVPARNGKVDPDLVKSRKADYDGIVKLSANRSSVRNTISSRNRRWKFRPTSENVSSSACGTQVASPTGSPTIRICSSTRRPMTSAPTTSSARSVRR
jgi:cyclohexanone monooxygenase